MSVYLPTIADYLRRTTGLVSASSDYSCVFWIKFRTVADYAIPFTFLDDPAIYADWAGIFTTGGSGDQLYVSTADSGATGDTTASPDFLEQEYKPVGYVRSGATQKFYFGGILIDDVVNNLAAATFGFEYIGFDGSAIQTDFEVSYFREWNIALTLTELITEWNSPTVVKTTNLWADFPFLTNANDISGNGRNWTSIGAPQFVSSAIPVPLTNITSGTAYDITGILPQERVQIVHDAGVTANHLWYKRTATIADGNVLSAYGWPGGPIPNPIPNTKYCTQINPYEFPNLATALLGIGAIAKPIQFPITIGTDYYLRFQKLNSIQNPTPAVLYARIAAAPITVPISGDIYVNDDTTGFPSVVLSSVTDYLVKRFYPNMPAGEAGDIVSNGNFLLDDIDTNDYKLFDINSNLLITYPTYSTFGYVIRKHIPTDSFYICQVRSLGLPSLTLKNYDNDGVELSSVTLTGITRTEGIAINDDQSILYHTRNTNGAVISRFNLNTLTAMSNLAAGVADHRCQDILFINGHLIVIYIKLAAPNACFIRRYDETGAIINTYTVTSFLGAADFAPRLAYANDNPISFWTYIQRSELTGGRGTARFINIRISDGGVLTNRLHSPFELGIGAQEATAPDFPPPGFFGPSESCPFFILPNGVSVTNTIQVFKITRPSNSPQSFDFTTTGGLLPSTFNLENGENELFINLANGTYGVTETPVDDWTTEYSVSNGDPHDAIVLSGGTNVIVIVTNTQAPNVNSGIYKIVPDKRQDTLWASFDPNSTEDVKIPNPFSRTALIGE